MGTLQSGRHTGGQGRGERTWHWKWSRHSGGAVAGTRSRLASPVAKREITHTLPHSCWGANGGWQGGLLLKSCRCLEMAFMWMGALIGVVRRLSLHAEHRVILFCWVLINKQCLTATMHLEGQHSDSLVALVLFVFESHSNSYWGDHIRLGGADVFPKLFSLIVKKKKKKKHFGLRECCGFQLWYWKYGTAKSCQLSTFSQTE